MKNWSFRKKFVFGLVFLLIAIFVFKGVKSYFRGEDHRITRNEILHLEINGVILNGKKFLAQLKKYKKDTTVKAIVIDINSPGGAVGPSQELYYEILRAKQETGKPVVCVSTGLIASGGYYASLACDKLIVAPGTMIGSIGVIMQFANLEKLYGWAMIERYSITTGKYKDSGADYRAMREDERELFQEMINEVYTQFKTTVAKSRNLPLETVTSYADGRVMTGSKAVELKFADAEGTFEDAVRTAAKMANLGDDYKLFRPKKEKISFMDILSFDDEDDDDLNSISEVRDYLLNAKGLSAKSIASELGRTFLRTKYLNQPLYLMPGYWE